MPELGGHGGRRKAGLTLSRWKVQWWTVTILKTPECLTFFSLSNRTWHKLADTLNLLGLVILAKFFGKKTPRQALEVSKKLFCTSSVTIYIDQYIIKKPSMYLLVLNTVLFPSSLFVLQQRILNVGSWKLPFLCVALSTMLQFSCDKVSLSWS